MKSVVSSPLEKLLVLLSMELTALEPILFWTWLFLDVVLLRQLLRSSNLARLRESLHLMLESNLLLTLIDSATLLVTTPLPNSALSSRSACLDMLLSSADRTISKRAARNSTLSLRTMTELELLTEDRSGTLTWSKLWSSRTSSFRAR